MSIINNNLIKNELAKSVFFDLSKNNARLDIITAIKTDPVLEIESIFDKICKGEKIEDGYYRLQNLFNSSNMADHNLVVNTIIKTVQRKLSSMNHTIYNKSQPMNDITMSMYIQIWESYRDFCIKMVDLVKNYQQYLVNTNIIADKHFYNIISIIQLCMYYESIIDLPSNSNLLILVSCKLEGIDKKNIKQLIDYIESIRSLMVMNPFANINYKQLISIIQSILNNTKIINLMCMYLDSMLKKRTNNRNVIDESEYETVDANDVKNQINRKIFRISTILAVYAEKTKLLFCYRKYMQSRIMDLTFDDLHFEIEVVKKMSGSFGKADSQKLISSIVDIINTKNINKKLQSAKLDVVSEEYKGINIPTTVLNPIIIKKNNWKIYNTSSTVLNYPLEMQYCFDIISKFYDHCGDSQVEINWQPTMGVAQFTAQFGRKLVYITCNILQAIALTYINSTAAAPVVIEKFSKDTFIDVDLANKIFESLFESNIVIHLSKTHSNSGYPIYIVNTNNYTGDTTIDLRTYFVEIFQVETETEPMVISEDTINPVPIGFVEATYVQSDNSECDDSECDSGSE